MVMKALLAWMISLIFIYAYICDAFALSKTSHTRVFEIKLMKKYSKGGKTSAKHIISIAGE